MTYYVYILSTRKRTVFYTGVTNNLKRRIREHKSHCNPGFTRRYNIDFLMYYEEYSSILEAIAREKEVKRFRRERKRQMIVSMNPTMDDLAKDW